METRNLTCIGCPMGCPLTVKIQSDIPKDKIFDCIHALKNITVSAPVHIGDVILKDIAHTGVAIIATKNVE